MASGSLQFVPVCVPRSTAWGVNAGGISVVCTLPDGTAGRFEVVQAYVLNSEPSQDAGSAAPPFDVVLGSQFFMFGFVGIASLYLVCHGIGLVLKMVRNH